MKGHHKFSYIINGISEFIYNYDLHGSRPIASNLQFLNELRIKVGN